MCNTHHMNPDRLHITTFDIIGTTTFYLLYHLWLLIETLRMASSNYRLHIIHVHTTCIYNMYMLFHYLLKMIPIVSKLAVIMSKSVT